MTVCSSQSSLHVAVGPDTHVAVGPDTHVAVGPDTREGCHYIFECCGGA